MELHGLLGICWCVLSGPGKLAAGNYEEGWSRSDGEEQAMAADGGRRDGVELMERSKQWQLTVGAGWNGVVGDSGGFERKLTEV